MIKFVCLSGFILVSAMLLNGSRPSPVDAQPVLAKEVIVKQLNKPNLPNVGEIASSGKIKPEPVKSVSQPVSGAKAFIYQHESGNRTDAINPSSGACGLGQALPCSKMPCSLSDYACQDNYFTSYMQGRYGTWENAKAWWMSHGTPCSNDVGWCGWW